MFEGGVRNQRTETNERRLVSSACAIMCACVLKLEVFVNLGCAECLPRELRTKSPLRHD